MSSTDIESVTVEPTAPPKLHLSFVSGLLMGAADSVPGVSGGTIALIVGVYERFIEALGTMIRSPALLRTAQGRTQIVGALWLLVPLGLGLLIAYAVGTRVLVGPKDEPGLLLRPETAPYCYAFFFGLVLVSLFEVWKRIRVAAKTHWVLALVGLGAAWLFTGLPHAATEPPVWTLLFGAAAALAVMLLPGVSGSMMLVILGQYTVVAGAVHDLNVVVIGVFAVGLFLGVVSFVPLLRFLLRRYHDRTLAVLTGLMAGSLRALWPWKSGYNPKASQMVNVGIGDQLVGCVVAALLGALTVWLLSRLEKRLLTTRAGQ